MIFCMSIGLPARQARIIMARIWTIQPAEVWEQLRESRSVYVQEDQYQGGYVPPAYRWLQVQLAGRLAAYSGHVPWWAYCRKPDLRGHRHLRLKGSVHVRLEVEVSDDSLVSFPCWAWHQVYCQDYLARTRREYEAWTTAMRRAVSDEDTWPLPEPWRSQLETSWQTLFDPNLRVLHWDKMSVWSRTACREAVFEVLRLEDVRRISLIKGMYCYRPSIT